MNEEREGRLARAAAAFSVWCEHWLPDALVFALLGTLVVIVAALADTGSTLTEVVEAWGLGFWELIPFTMQMALVIITGHVLATSRPILRVIRLIAAQPRSPRAAVALVAFFAMATAWINWGFSLVFSAVLALEIARRMEGVDYRALAAASFLGLGSVWAQGLSGSAALQMASAGALQPMVRDIVAHGNTVPQGIVTFRHTIFLWQSLLSVLVEIVVVTGVMWFATPPPSRSRSARDLGISLRSRPDEAVHQVRPLTPGARLEHSAWLTWFVVALGAGYLVIYFMRAKEPLGALTLNTVNLAFLMAGFLLHGTPARLTRAVQEATPAVWGVILQFPFYAGIAGIITSTHLNERLAAAFISLSSKTSFPAVVAMYSAVLGVFVPSGGSKWVIEAPYVMAAAHALNVHIGWVVTSYDLGEALANLLQPFWMLPILGLFQLGARDVMGYTLTVFLVLTPIVLVLLTVLGLTLPYPL